MLLLVFILQFSFHLSGQDLCAVLDISVDDTKYSAVLFKNNTVIMYYNYNDFGLQPVLPPGQWTIGATSGAILMTSLFPSSYGGPITNPAVKIVAKIPSSGTGVVGNWNDYDNSGNCKMYTFSQSPRNWFQYTQCPFLSLTSTCSQTSLLTEKTYRPGFSRHVKPKSFSNLKPRDYLNGKDNSICANMNFTFQHFESYHYTMVFYSNNTASVIEYHDSYHMWPQTGVWVISASEDGTFSFTATFNSIPSGGYPSALFTAIVPQNGEVSDLNLINYDISSCRLYIGIPLKTFEWGNCPTAGLSVCQSQL